MAEFMMYLILFILSVTLGWKLNEFSRCSSRKQFPATELHFYHNGKRIYFMKMKITQLLALTVAPKDAKGNPALVDGVPTWALTDPALATIAVAADGMSAVVTPVGPLGICDVQVSADADLGAGTKTILGALPAEFLAGDAVSVEISGIASDPAAPVA